MQLSRCPGIETLLDQIVEQGRFGVEAASRERGKNLVKEFVAQVLDGSMTVAKDAEMMINARIAQIDHLLSLQLNEILHHPQFQKLEGSWRGLKHLMDHSETGVGLKIRVLNVSKKELLRDIEKAPEFDQSALFKKVYEEEYGVFGGAPFGAAFVGDYRSANTPEEPWPCSRASSHVAAQAHAPFVQRGVAGPDEPRELSAAWMLPATWQRSSTARNTPSGSRSARARTPAMWHSPCRVRAWRLPYGAETKPIDEFVYEEHVDGTDHSKYLWMNASYSLALKDDSNPFLALRNVRCHARSGRRRTG